MEHPLTVLSFLPQSVQDQYGHVLMLTFIMLLILCIGLFVRNMTSEVPSRGQVVMEGIVRYMYDMGESIMGHEGAKYMPLVMGIGFYVAISNMSGLVPGLVPPTMNMNTTAAPALCVFFFYQYLGIKKHGMHYFSQFFGPIKVLAPLIFLIEIISQFARPLSLTMRLFGNVSGEEIVIAILFMLVPFLVPLPMYVLSAFTGLLQAFVFMLLAMVYIGGALEESH